MTKRSFPRISLVAGVAALAWLSHAPVARACGPDDAPVVVRPKPVEVATTKVKVTVPANVTISILDGETVLATFSSTVTFSVRTGKTLTLQASRNDKVVLSAPFKATGPEMEIAFVDDGGSPTMSTKAVAATPAASTTKPMSTKAFDALITLLHDASFDSDRLDLLKASTAKAHLSMAQAKKVLAEFSFDSTRLSALTAISNRVTDPENAALVAKSFTFAANQKKALALFAKA